MDSRAQDGWTNRLTIRREPIGTIVHNHGRFDSDLDTTITKAIEESHIEEQGGEFVATERINELIPGRRYSIE